MNSHRSKYLADAARRAFDDAGGDLDAAQVSLIAQSATDERLRADLVGAGAYAAVSWLTAVDRRTSWRHASAATAGADDTAGLRLVANQTLLDTYRLVGGKPIGDATREDLIASAQHHDALSVSNARAAKFERLVAKAMGKAATVREAVTNGKLVELQQAAERAVKAGGANAA